MSDNNLQEANTLSHWLTLAAVPRFGTQRLQLLLAKSGLTPAELVTLSATELQALGFCHQQCQAIASPDRQKQDKALNWQQSSPGRAIISYDHPGYPPLLKHIASAPMLLFVEGSAQRLQDNQLAIVGSRRPSHSGREQAKRFAAELVAHGFTVTSGLAVGIDGVSHQAAVNASGQTIAVLGCGIEQDYPKQHRQLRQQIINQGGCIVSEFFPDTPVRAEHFPRRNRIVSGLSLGVLVVEAAVRSGSLITARYALEQNREVFAIPGNIRNSLAAGCHFLIKQGAKLVETIEDITEEFHNLGLQTQKNGEISSEKSTGESLASDKLLDSVDIDVTAVDVIAERSNQPVSVVLASLLQYELRGLVTAVPGGYIKLGGK